MATETVEYSTEAMVRAAHSLPAETLMAIMAGLANAHHDPDVIARAEIAAVIGVATHGLSVGSAVGSAVKRAAEWARLEASRAVEIPTSPDDLPDAPEQEQEQEQERMTPAEALDACPVKVRPVLKGIVKRGKVRLSVRDIAKDAGMPRPRTSDDSEAIRALACMAFAHWSLAMHPTNRQGMPRDVDDVARKAWRFIHRNLAIAGLPVWNQGVAMPAHSGRYDRTADGKRIDLDRLPPDHGVKSWLGGPMRATRAINGVTEGMTYAGSVAGIPMPNGNDTDGDQSAPAPVVARRMTRAAWREDVRAAHAMDASHLVGSTCKRPKRLDDGASVCACGGRMGEILIPAATSTGWTLTHPLAPCESPEITTWTDVASKETQAIARCQCKGRRGFLIQQGDAWAHAPMRKAARDTI
jgi:hypothetical protein